MRRLLALQAPRLLLWELLGLLFSLPNPRSEQEIDAFVNRFVKDWKLEIPPPSLADFRTFVQHVAQSGCGPDEIPYAGWLFA